MKVYNGDVYSWTRWLKLRCEGCTGVSGHFSCKNKALHSLDGCPNNSLNDLGFCPK